MLTALTLAALNLAIRLPRMRRPVWASVWIGLLFTLMMLTKTTAVFLLPALVWAMVLPLWQKGTAAEATASGFWSAGTKVALRCALAAACTFAVTFGLWMALVVRFGLLPDYKYLFFVNKYVKPPEFYWPLLSLWWAFHGGLWVDHILIPLAGVVVLGAAATGTVLAGRGSWGRRLLLDPVFGASVCAVAGYILFMTYQNHPQPRYFAVVAFFSFFVIAQGAEALLGYSAQAGQTGMRSASLRLLGWGVISLAAMASGINAAWTLSYATHPPSKLAHYQPGWWATWNDIDPGTLEDLHNHYSLEQVASFRAFDDPDRNLLVLFKLHPLLNGQDRSQGDMNLQVPLPDDKIDIPVQ